MPHTVKADLMSKGGATQCYGREFNVVAAPVTRLRTSRVTGVFPQYLQHLQDITSK